MGEIETYLVGRLIVELVVILEVPKADVRDALKVRALTKI